MRLEKQTLSTPNEQAETSIRTYCILITTHNMCVPEPQPTDAL